MPRFTVGVDLPVPAATAFQLLIRPARLPELTPPELALENSDAPEELQLGSSWTMSSRRFGMRHRGVMAVTAFEPQVSFAAEQREGAFRTWQQRLLLTQSGDRQCHLVETVEFEPPGGMLGLLLTSAAVERELADLFRYRHERLSKLLIGES